MDLSEFDYKISENQIAQSPLPERDSSNLLVLHKKSNTIEHRRFRDITEYLCCGDVLVLNNTKVIPARLCGSKPSGGKAEITLLQEVQKNSWEALVKGVHKGPIMLKHGITAHVSRINGTTARVNFDFDSNLEGTEKADIKGFLNESGVMPLPLYIKRDAVRSDKVQYQTVYASREGAVAAPTAGLHFTEQLLTRIKENGVQVVTVTLHVGYGTFKPVTVSDIKNHQMDTEIYEIPEETADTINSAKSEGRRVIAVGTTVTRTLEASASDETTVSKNNPSSPPFTKGRNTWGTSLKMGKDKTSPPLEKGDLGGFDDTVPQQTAKVKAGKGEASIFIYPGYTFKIIDAFVTNFHLPKSTPFMLVSAFTDINDIKTAYFEAQNKGYRFYSYGDAMLIV
jgi:S-adenosylmethionine:tRNA ribosyltransferase-isomerase